MRPPHHKKVVRARACMWNSAKFSQFFVIDRKFWHGTSQGPPSMTTHSQLSKSVRYSHSRCIYVRKHTCCTRVKVNRNGRYRTYDGRFADTVLGRTGKREHAVVVKSTRVQRALHSTVFKQGNTRQRLNNVLRINQFGFTYFIGLIRASTLSDI